MILPWNILARLGYFPVESPAFRYLSLCSGIEAASEAWHSLGGRPVAFSEIEPFPCAVLAHRWPGVPNLGDMTRWREWPEDLLAQVDVLVGGTPCQAFSVAGLRNSLADERGNLTLVYAHLLDHIDGIRRKRGLPPVVCVWENVPGVLNTKDNAFGCFLGALAGEDIALVAPRDKWTNAGLVFGPERAICWRVLDAQYFGVPQRRRRVFLVGSARNGFRPDSVLFESEGVRRDSPPRREARQSTTYELAPCLAASGRGFERTGDTRGQDCVVADNWPAEIAPTLNAHFGEKQGLEDQHINGGGGLFVPDTTHTLRGEGFDASEDGTGRGTPLVPVHTTGAGFWQEGFGTLRAREQDSRENLVCVHGTQDPCHDGHRAFSLGRNNGGENVVAFSCKDHGGDASEIAPTLRSMGHDSSHANGGGQVAVAFAIQDGALRENPNSGPQGKGYQSDLSYTLEAREALSKQQCVAFAQNSRDELREMPYSGALAANPGAKQISYLRLGSSVRRLTPRECERLQGFPDDYTLIPWRGKAASECPDGPRYKALGNSMAVPCMEWIGKRLLAAIK